MFQTNPTQPNLLRLRVGEVVEYFRCNALLNEEYTMIFLNLVFSTYPPRGERPGTGPFVPKVGRLFSRIFSVLRVGNGIE